MTQGQLHRPESRYGRQRLSRRSRRWVVIALALVVVTIAGSAAVIGYQRINATDVAGEMVAYRLIDAQTVEVTVSVTRADPSQRVVCIIRGRSRDGSETGRRELLVPASDATTVQVIGLVKTSGPPAVGDVYGCGTEVPSYLVEP
jgi:Domain of unknown function (DUF4307)